MRIIFPAGALFSLFAIFTCAILPSAIATAATTTVQDILILAGNYYVGDVFGKQDYRGHANAAVSSYRIMKTEVTYALYSSVSDWGVQHGYLLDQGCEDCYSDPEDRKSPSPP